MSVWYINLSGSNASGANSVTNPYSAQQFFDLAYGLEIEGFSALDGDIFKLCGYYNGSSTKAVESILDITIQAWDLIKYGPWVLDSLIGIVYSNVSFRGGIIVVNSPVNISLGNLRNVLLITTDAAGAVTLNSNSTRGVTIIGKGNTGDLFGTPVHSFLDSMLILENPFSASLPTTIDFDHSVTNLVNGAGAGEFFSGTNITSGTVTSDTQFGWTAPAWSVLPYVGIPNTAKDVKTLYTSNMLLTPQSIYNTLPNYSASLITISLSSGAHSEYSTGLFGESRLYDNGSTSGRVIKCNGIGSWVFNQEGVKVDDIKDINDIITRSLNTSGGSFSINDGVIKSLYGKRIVLSKENITNFPNISDVISSGNFTKFNYLCWIRNYSYVDENTYILTIDRPTNIQMMTISIKNANTLKINTNEITLPTSLSTNTWHMITVMVDYRDSYYVKIYFDDEKLTIANFKLALTGTASLANEIKVLSIGDSSIEIAKPRLSITERILDLEVIENIYNSEINELPL